MLSLSLSLSLFLDAKRKPSASNPPLLFRLLLRGYLRWQVFFLFDGTRSYSIADYDKNIKGPPSPTSARPAAREQAQARM
jgi:hypothetical protein